MRRLLLIIGVICAIGANAASLPSWATGTFKGTVKNWCYVYDDPHDVGPWYGKASFTVSADGNMSGEIKLDDLHMYPTGNYTVESVSDGEVRIVHEFAEDYRKTDESERGIEYGHAKICIRNSAGKVSLEYSDDDERYADILDKCPIEGVLEKTGSTVSIPAEWQKARTLNGVATRALPNPYVGTFTVKCSKAKKDGTARISAVYTPFSGKKATYRAQTVDVTGGAVIVSWDGLEVTIDVDGFRGDEGLPGGLCVSSADIGGDWVKSAATVCVVVDDVFGAEVLTDLLPNEEQAAVNGGKWAFAKAASVKWAKPKRGTELKDLPIYDEASGKGLIIDTAKSKTNLSGLKLTYTPKKGTFKGSFKVYALEGAGKATKLKKYTVKVTGIVVDGVGYGEATCKRLAASWSVTVR